MRGFDLDHGTDIAFFADGAPINAVSHAHGHGYSDLHFIIPEVIDSLESTKGPYSARVGDFATAGSVTFHLADHLSESVGRVEVGPDGHRRGVVAESPNLGDNWRALVAADLFNEDGPFIHPEGYDRFNGYAKVTRVLDEKSELSLMLSAYGGTWNMSGLLPARAVCGEGDGTPTPTALLRLPVLPQSVGLGRPEPRGSHPAWHGARDVRTAQIGAPRRRGGDRVRPSLEPPDVS